MSVQTTVINQVKASLEALVTAGILKRVYTEPTAIEQASEYPYAFFRLGADLQFDLQTTGGGKYYHVGHLQIVLVAAPADEYATKDLVDLIDSVRLRLVQDRASFSRVSLRSIRLADDLNVAALFGPFAVGVLELEFFGTEVFA